MCTHLDWPCGSKRESRRAAAFPLLHGPGERALALRSPTVARCAVLACRARKLLQALAPFFRFFFRVGAMHRLCSAALDRLAPP
jgi:hypothetical protein